MEAGRTTQQVILEKIRDRLRDEIDEFNEGNCFISDFPSPLKCPPVDVFCTISAGPGVFGQAQFDGGGALTLTEHATVDITPFRRGLLDQTDRMEDAILGDELGLITRYKVAVLTAMFGLDDDDEPWEPQASSLMLLRNQLSPIRVTAPTAWKQGKGADYIFFTLTLGTDFDWEI